MDIVVEEGSDGRVTGMSRYENKLVLEFLVLTVHILLVCPSVMVCCRLRA
jgi:hypothetical protein